MNEVQLSGWLYGKPSLIGEGKGRGIRFSLRAVNKYRKDKDMVETSTSLQCVCFNCPEKLEELMLSGKKLWVEGASGRLVSSSYETPEGRKFSMNVVYDAAALSVMER